MAAAAALAVAAFVHQAADHAARDSGAEASRLARAVWAAVPCFVDEKRHGPTKRRGIDHGYISNYI